MQQGKFAKSGFGAMSARANVANQRALNTRASMAVMRLLETEQAQSLAEIASAAHFEASLSAHSAELMRHSDLMAATPSDSSIMRCIRSGRVIGWMHTSAVQTHIPASIAPQFIRVNREAFTQAIESAPSASIVALVLANFGGDMLDSLVSRHMADDASMIDVINQRQKLIAHMHDGLLTSPSANVIACLHQVIAYLQDAPSKAHTIAALEEIFLAAQTHLGIQPASARQPLAASLTQALSTYECAILTKSLSTERIYSAKEIDTLRRACYPALASASAWDYTPILPSNAAAKKLAPSARTLRSAEILRELSSALGDLSLAASDVSSADLNTGDAEAYSEFADKHGEASANTVEVRRVPAKANPANTSFNFFTSIGKR